MSASLVGSEMCIRDRSSPWQLPLTTIVIRARGPNVAKHLKCTLPGGAATVSYTHLTLPTICSV
eukprot:10049310-Alexandrium_andersonii.AAC.1